MSDASGPDWGKVGAYAGIASVVVALLAWLVPHLGTQTGISTASGGTDPTATAAAPDSAPPADTSRPAPVSAVVRHQGRHDIAHGGSADLDADSSDPTWGAASPAQADLFYGNSGGFRNLYTRGPATGVMTGVATADYDTCSSLGRYSASAAIGQSALSIGTRFCIFTGAQRYTGGVVVDFSQDFITVDLTTYDPPGVGAGAPRPTDPAENPVRVRHQGQLQIAHGGGADLDADGGDAEWAARVLTGADLFYGDSGGFRNLYVRGPAKGVMTGVTSTDYSTCSRLTRYSESAIIRSSELSSGRSFCILTGGGRYAAGTVVDFQQDHITVDLVSYDPPEA